MKIETAVIELQFGPTSKILEPCYIFGFGGQEIFEHYSANCTHATDLSAVGPSISGQ